MVAKYKFFRSGIMLSAVGLAMRSVSMFFGAYVSRTVGAEGVGLFTLVMTVYSFAATFATSGISLTVTRLVASASGEGRESEIPSILRAALLYSFFFGAAAALFLFFGADFLGAMVLSDGRVADSLKLLSVSLVPLSLGSVFSGYFVGVKRVGFNAATQVFAQAVKIFLTVVLVSYLADRGTVYAVIALCLSSALTELLSFVCAFLEFMYDRRKYRKDKVSSPLALKGVAKTALPLAFSAYVRSLLLNIEHILIPRKLRERGEGSAEAYAHYGALHGMAVPMILYPMSPLSSFSSLLVPEFAEDMAAGNRARMSRVASRAMNATLSYATFCSVFLFVFAEELGYAVYDSYDAGYYISVLSFILPIMYLDHVTDSVLKGLGEQVFSMWVNITDSLLSVILVWFLIPRLGIIGYALVIVIMEGYNFLLSVVRLTKLVKFKIELLSSFLTPLFISLASAMLTKRLFCFGGSSSPAFWLVMKMIFSLSVSVAMLALLRAHSFKKQKNIN